MNMLTGSDTCINSKMPALFCHWNKVSYQSNLIKWKGLYWHWKYFYCQRKCEKNMNKGIVIVYGKSVQYSSNRKMYMGYTSITFIHRLVFMLMHTPGEKALWSTKAPYRIMLILTHLTRGCCEAVEHSLSLDHPLAVSLHLNKQHVPGLLRTHRSWPGMDEKCICVCLCVYT